jgi:cysteine synthase A
MSKGICGGEHRIQGIGDGFVPQLVKLDRLDDVLVIHDGDAVLMAQLLAKKLGLGVGISSGANFIASVIAQELYGEDKSIVTVFSDDSKKYLTSDLLNNEPIKENYITPHIELIDMDGECICDSRIMNGTCLKQFG